MDLIRLQKQLSDKTAALRVTQEKFTDLQEVRRLVCQTVPLQFINALLYNKHRLFSLYKAIICFFYLFFFLGIWKSARGGKNSGISSPVDISDSTSRVCAHSNFDCVVCLPQSQRSLRESQGALLEKVEELTEQLKQERQRALSLEGQLTTINLSQQTLDKVPQLHLYLYL